MGVLLAPSDSIVASLSNNNLSRLVMSYAAGANLAKTNKNKNQKRDFVGTTEKKGQHEQHYKRAPSYFLVCFLRTNKVAVGSRV